MLSLTCKTAIKAVIYLASKYESGEKSGIKEIAEYIDASEHTVGKMLQTLVKGEDKVMPGCSANGVVNVAPEMPGTKCGTAFAKNAPAQNMDT